MVKYNEYARSTYNVRLVQTVKSNVRSTYYFIAHVVRFNREKRLAVSKREKHVQKNAACHQVFSRSLCVLVFGLVRLNSILMVHKHRERERDTMNRMVK